MHAYRPYKKSADYSYAVGIFPTIELLTHRPHDVQTIFVAPNSNHSQGVQKIRTLCQQHDIPCVEDAKTITRVARDDHSFALGVFKKFHSQLDAQSPHVVLVNPSDTGNLGTILRTMLGFGHHDLAIITPAVDMFDPKVIRASMGALFRQRVATFDSFESYRTAYSHTLYSFVLDTKNTLGTTTFANPYSLVFGNEGAGLPADFAKIGTPVRIEQTDAIDSLNLAISVGVALYTAFSRA